MIAPKSLRTSTRRTSRHLALAICVVGVSSLATLAFDDDEDGPALDGVAAETVASILPEEAPNELSADEFAELPESWNTWGEDVSTLISDLYEDTDLSDADRQNITRQLRTKSGTLTKAINDHRYQSIHGTLKTLRNRLNRRLDVIDAAYASLQNDSTISYVSPSTLEVSQALLDVENLLNNKSTGQKWKTYLGTDDCRFLLNNTHEHATRVDALKKLHAKLLDEDGDLEDEQSEFLSSADFQNLANAIEDLVAATNAANPAMRTNALRSDIARLLAAVEDHEAGARSTAADDVQRIYKYMKRVYPGAGQRLGQTLRNHYFNYNMHVVIPEALIIPLATETKNESGPVNDCILGARVNGTQNTSVNVGLDVKPSANGFLFRLNLDGATQSHTTARKAPATIRTQGNHFFNAQKDIYFDGNSVSAGPTRLGINTNNTTLSANTKYDWVPIFGGIARNIAYKKTQEMRPQSEAIAAQKLRERVEPKLDAEVGQKLADANNAIAQGMGRLRSANLYPSSISARSSETHLALSTRTMRKKQMGGSAPDSGYVPNDGIGVQIHESLINNAIDELDLAGKKLKEDQLLPHLEIVLTRLLGRPISLAKPQTATPYSMTPPVGSGDPLLVPPGGNESGDSNDDEDDEDSKEEPPSTFVFDPTDPIRVKLEDGFLTLILRTGIEQEGKDPIPLQVIEVPITFELSGPKVVFEAGSPRITAVKSGGFKQIARAAQIRRILEAKLPRRELDSTFNLMVEGSQVAMSVSAMRSNDGWLSMYITATKSNVIQSSMPIIQPYDGTIMNEQIIDGQFIDGQIIDGQMMNGQSIVYPSYPVESH